MVLSYVGTAKAAADAAVGALLTLAACLITTTDDLREAAPSDASGPKVFDRFFELAPGGEEHFKQSATSLWAAR